MEGIRADRQGEVLEVVIDREHAANSLDPTAHAAMAGILDDFEADDRLRVAIVTGVGDRFFCAGHDLKSVDPGARIPLPATGFGGLTARPALEKPVISAVNGLALGGGAELVLASHLVVAAEHAELALTEVLVGMVAAAGGVVRLPRRIPSSVALELILTGRRIGAAEAERWGLVNRVVPRGCALTGARLLADSVLGASPTSVRLSLRLLNLSRARSEVDPDPDEVAQLLDELLASPDTAEALAAFRERRNPVWAMRGGPAEPDT
ncbi:MAG: enoyl-CoA hydratase-related protein [Candidatus Nanopelagicales bacterium]